MSQYYKQMQPKHNEARKQLDERLAREDMGDAEYEKMIAQGDGGTFKIVGVVLMLAFAGAVLAVTALGL